MKSPIKQGKKLLNGGCHTEAILCFVVLLCESMNNDNGLPYNEWDNTFTLILRFNRMYEA